MKIRSDSDEPKGRRRELPEESGGRLLLIDQERDQIVLLDVRCTEQHPISSLRASGVGFERMLDVYASLGYRLVERRAVDLSMEPEQLPALAAESLAPALRETPQMRRSMRDDLRVLVQADAYDGRHAVPAAMRGCEQKGLQSPAQLIASGFAVRNTANLNRLIITDEGASHLYKSQSERKRRTT
jgi:hypothetical protein